MKFVLRVEETTHKRFLFEFEPAPDDPRSAEEQAVAEFASMSLDLRQYHGKYLDTPHASWSVAATTEAGAAKFTHGTYSATMEVSAEMATKMQECCNVGLPDCGRAELLFDQEHVFPDYRRMAIQVWSGEGDEPGWTQGVLYGPEGTELGCTEVGESFLGDYTVRYENIEYTVEVVG